MNIVPFDQLGPGQSGRLAYQVLGQNGPIFNPQNIRYLSPDSPEIPTNPMVAGESGLSAGLAGANLIASILNLGVSVYIAHRVNSLHKKVDHLQETMDRIEHKIDYIVTKVDRIDTQVAENNLRHALEHVLRKSVSSEGVDLRVLAGLCHDFDKFQESLPSPLLLNFGLQLSSDIRDQLQQVYDLIYGIRKLVTQRYNTSVDGDPECIITVTPYRDYFRIFGSDLETLIKTTLVKTTILRSPIFEEMVEELQKVEKLQEFLRNKRLLQSIILQSPLQVAVEKLQEFFIENRDYFSFGEVDVVKKNLQKILNGEINSFSEIFTEWVFLDELLPDDIFKDETPEEIEQGLYDLSYGWLYQTDAGLLWRTKIELDGIASGYENIFWPQLQESEPCGFNQIEVACEVPLLENA